MRDAISFQMTVVFGGQVVHLQTGIFLLSFSFVSLMFSISLFCFVCSVEKALVPGDLD